MAFNGFRDESFAFFRDLAANNHELWFEAHREDFEDHVLQPFRELVDELGPFFEQLHPSFVKHPTEDERFSRIELGGETPPEGPHYKTSFYSFWWNADLPRLADAHMHVGLGGEAVTLGFSIYDWAHENGRMREIFLPRIHSDLDLLDEYIKGAYLRRGFDFRRFTRGVGRLGLREADPFPTKAEEWDSTLGWVVSRQIKEGSSRLTPGSFVSECQSTFERLHPLYVFASETRGDWRGVLENPA